MPRKTVARKAKPVFSMVNFDFGNRTYQIDPHKQKVYRGFVEIETSKAFEIYSVWRTSNLRAC